MKKILSILILTFLILPVFALPGFTPYLPDNSGDYVFYKDNSFARESYVGFLCYDNATYQLRYFAPTDKQQNLPEKNIAILFTLNPEKNYLDLTGEKILSTIMPDTEDVELVNYLHDMFYEFSSRRIKADPISPDYEDYVTDKDFWNNGLWLNTDYVQFGGKVSTVYDVMIPLFNLKRIVDAEGNDILSAVTCGTLVSSEDTSFDDFKGVTNKIIKKEPGAKLNRKAKATDFIYENLTIQLDENWTQGMENLWLLGDAAIATITTLPSPSVNSDRYDYYVLRHLIMSPQDSYVDIAGLNIKPEENGYVITSNIYQHETDNIVKNFKVLSKDSNGKITLKLFTAFQRDYSANKKYFDDLIKKNK